MIRAYQNRFLQLFIVIIFLLVIQVAGFIYFDFIAVDSNAVDINTILAFNNLMMPFFYLIEVLTIYLLYLLAKAKGYSGWLCLLGFLNIFGFAILAILPDKAKSVK